MLIKLFCKIFFIELGVDMFTDRRDAGRRLAEKLKHYKSCKGVLVLALPRGGAVTGLEIARAIGAPLDVLIVRK
jgi:predicted phosphoribosyltransferase